MPAKYSPEEQLAAFWARVNKDGPTQPHMDTPCWVWTAASDSGGYGHGRWCGPVRKAHRVAYELANGPIPDGMQVNHRCDHRPCVRPDHTHLGTNQTNIDEKVARGRSTTGDRSGARKHPERVPRGEANGLAKLTATDIPIIRARSKAGESHRSIARTLGVGHRTIGHVLAGESWGHVE